MCKGNCLGKCYVPCDARIALRTERDVKIETLRGYIATLEAARDYAHAHAKTLSRTPSGGLAALSLRGLDGAIDCARQYLRNVEAR